MSAYNDIIILQRPISTRRRMSIQHRAKIFAPFAALKGFDQSIQKEERLLISSKEFSEDIEDAFY